MAHALRDKIRLLVAPALTDLGYEVVDVEWVQQRARWLLRIYIDQPDGITHEDCTAASREISTILDVSDIIPQAYVLEVSSPGLDRPLRSPEHFRKFIGETARVRLRQGVEGRRNFTGTIVRVDDDEAVVLEAGGREFTLPVDDVDKANLKYSFEG